MKNCVVQFYMESAGFPQPNFVNIKVNEELLEYSKKSSKLYANKCGADYILINKPKINHIHPTFERFDLFSNMKWWKKYDHILYLDTDVICWPSAPNIFEMYSNKESFKVCEDRIAKKKSTSWHEQREKDTILSNFKPEVLRTNRFNAGVFMLNEYSANIISAHLKYKEYNDDDNRILIHAVLSSGVSTEFMDWRFNKKNGVKSWFGHGYGQEKYKTNNKLLSMARQIFKI
jgi:lipopolysaccharide biosynthesis glycosyltransferase